MTCCHDNLSLGLQYPLKAGHNSVCAYNPNYGDLVDVFLWLTGQEVY